MPLFLHRVLHAVQTRLTGWRLPLAVAAFVFVTSWLLMLLVERGASDLAAPGNYWWYFLVTAATVGYGDLFPKSVGGRLVGAYIIIGGIVTLTILFAQLAGYLQTARGKLMKGHGGVEMRGHTVILGYAAGRTEKIISELNAEDPVQVVLCAWSDVPEHPMPDLHGVRFVRGDLTNLDVMVRAAVADAATVLIDARDDNETLAILVAAHHANGAVHTVATLRDLNRGEHLRYVNPLVQVVQWHMPNLLVEEAQDPGITQVYTDLMSSGGHGNTYSGRLAPRPAAGSFGECQTLFGQRHGATVIAVRQGDGLMVSPAWDTRLSDGAIVYYLAADRIEDPELVVRHR